MVSSKLYYINFIFLQRGDPRHQSFCKTHNILSKTNYTEHHNVIFLQDRFYNFDSQNIILPGFHTKYIFFTYTQSVHIALTQKSANYYGLTSGALFFIFVMIR